MSASLFLIITCSVSLVSFFYSLASSISFFHKGKNSVYKKRKKRMQRTKNAERAQEASMINSEIIYRNLTARSMPGLTLKRSTSAGYVDPYCAKKLERAIPRCAL